MAYITGTANTVADLLTAIQSACTANGWTLSGNVLNKGTCFTEVKVAGGVISVRGGRGVDGSNNLTSPCDSNAGAFTTVIYGSASSTLKTNVPFAYPARYCIHVLTAPDEVYVAVNYSATWYQLMGFGASPTPGLTGTGTWYSAPQAPAGYPWLMHDDGEYWATAIGSGLGLFAGAGSGAGVDHALDSATWKTLGAWRDTASLMLRQPSQWNAESTLMPIRVYASRPSGFVSVVHECAHARYVSIDTLNAEQIITLGTDRWVVYPWGAKGTRITRGSNGAWIFGTNTGHLGHAIRYDGP